MSWEHALWHLSFLLYKIWRNITRLSCSFCKTSQHIQPRKLSLIQLSDHKQQQSDSVSWEGFVEVSGSYWLKTNMWAISVLWSVVAWGKQLTSALKTFMEEPWKQVCTFKFNLTLVSIVYGKYGSEFRETCMYDWQCLFLSGLKVQISHYLLLYYNAS